MKSKYDWQALIPKIDRMRAAQSMTATQACKAFKVPVSQYYARKSRTTNAPAKKAITELQSILSKPATPETGKVMGMLMIGDPIGVAKALAKFAEERGQ